MSQENRKYIVGIDLGTSTTVVSCLNDTVPEPRPDPFRASDQFTPSAVLIRDGNVVVGTAALNERAADPDHVVVEAKRHIASPKRFPAADPQLLAHEVMAEVLYYRLKDLPQHAAAVPANTISVMISVPAYYGDLERKRTLDAWEIAHARLKADPANKEYSFECLGLVDEPLAAAVCQCYEEAGVLNDKPFLVLDLGGGTFDLTAYQTELRADIGRLFVKVLAKDGEQQLGGIDWDRVLADMWASQAKTTLKKLEESIANDESAQEEFYRLMKDCEEVRIQLSNLDRTRIIASHHEKRIKLDVKRDEFEEKCHDLMKRLEDCIDRVVERVKEETRLDESAFQVLLVGGATHMPMIQKIIRARFNAVQVRQHRSPQLAVSRGTSLYCGIRNGVRFANQTLRNVQDIEVCDLLTRSYGLLGVKKGTYGLSVVIPRNSLCNGSEFEFRDARVSERRTDVIEIPFGAVPEVHEYGDFVPMKENDSGRSDQLVEMRIRNGIVVERGQPLRIFLSPQPNGTIEGRAELLDFNDQKIDDVKFSLIDPR